MEGAEARLRREATERAWLAWHVAFMTAYAPPKARDFFRIERLVPRAARKPAERPSAEEDFARLEAWVAGTTARR